MAAIAAVTFVSMTGIAAADAVTDWNEVLLGIIRAEKVTPPMATRALAVMHTAIYDAVNGCGGDYEPYLMPKGAPSGASPEAAAIQAAHDALIYLYPKYWIMLDLNESASLRSVPEGDSREDGLDWGAKCATAIVDSRKNDGWNVVVPYVPTIAPGWWVPTPSDIRRRAVAELAIGGLLVHAGRQRLSLAGGHRRSIARNTRPRSTRSGNMAGRTEACARRTRRRSPLFWNDGAGSATPPGHWNSIAQDVAFDHGNDLRANARLFALLNVAAADAAIVAWDNKYAYSHWRPVTAIHQAFSDGNAGTAYDPSWTPLIPHSAVPRIRFGPQHVQRRMFDHTRAILRYG